jgi:lysophospholipase L1-like esterase
MAGIIELDSALEILQVARRSEVVQAMATANIFADTDLGLLSGEPYFSVPSAEADEYLVLYRNDAGAAVEVDRYPNALGVINARDAAEAFAADVLSVAQEVSADRLASQQAADAAQLSAGVYATTAAGLLATPVDRYFSVPSPDASEYLVLYQNAAGVAVEVKRYPGSVVGDEAHYGLLPFITYNANNPTSFNSLSGFVRTVVNGRIQFAPDGVTATVGYFARTLSGAGRIDPTVNGKLRYRIRRTAGTLNRLYVVKVRDSLGVYSDYYPYSATPNNLVDDGGWVTYEVDLTRKPDGTEWTPGILLDQIYVSLSYGNGNSTWQLDWLIVGQARSDVAPNADLKRQAALSAAGLAAEVTARTLVDTSATKRDTYGYLPFIEANSAYSTFWAALSGFTKSVVGGVTVFSPDGATATNGFAARSLSVSEKFDPTVYTSLKYRIKRTGSAARAYMIYLHDATSAAGYYYNVAASAKYSLVDDTSWVTYEVDISKKPDGTAWAGAVIDQIYLSLSAGTGETSWSLDWLVVGKPLHNLIPNSELLRLATQVNALPVPAPVVTTALNRLKAALYNPLHSPTLHLVADSIGWGVGATGSLTGGVNNGDLGDTRNILTNNTWANLLHRWLGESFADGVLVAGDGVASYSANRFVAFDNPFYPGDGPYFHIYNNGAKVVPVSKFNAAAYTGYYYAFDAVSAGASGHYNQPIQFELTGDNLSVMYCAINTADPAGSIVELWGNGALLGSFSYYGAESFSQLANITFPFGKYQMSLVNKSGLNTFRLEGFKVNKTVKLINDSLSGTSTGTWLATSPNLLGVIAKTSEFVFVQLGTNDRSAKGPHVTYLNLASIAKTLVAAGKDVVMMAANAIPAAGESPNGGKVYGQREVAMVTKQVASELGLAFINNHEATVMAKIKGETWTADGLHPNDYGYGLMFDNIRSAILES